MKHTHSRKMMFLVAIRARLSISRTLAMRMGTTTIMAHTLPLIALLRRQDNTFWLPLALDYVNVTP